MDREAIIAKAIPFFTGRAYQVQSQSDILAVFKSESRDVNWVVFIIACIFGLFPGIIYYIAFCPPHQVTLSISGDKDAKISVNGNTDKARRDAMDFLGMIG
jgi:hypothetical protein